MRLWGLQFRDFGAFLWVVVILGFVALLLAGPSRHGATALAASNEGQIAHGRYIVEGVAMCGMCHTPRNDSGDIETNRELDGASVWLMPAHPVADWPLKAPRIAGTPPASDENMVRLLTTGIWKDGTRLRPPMPQFRMNPEDAKAVVAYLRSLTPEAGD